MAPPEGLTLQRLHYFSVIAEKGSLRHASETLHITQPALSAHIHGLERALGLLLFERKARGVRLTAAGRLIHERIRKTLEGTERLVEYAQNLATGREGVVSLACYPVHIERFLARVIGIFRQENPDVKVDLTRLRDDRRRGAGRTLIDELLAGEVDLTMSPPHPNLGLEGVKVYDAHIVAMVPDNDPFRHATEIDISYLQDKPLLIAPPDYFSRGIVEHVASESGFSLNVEVQSSSPAALVELGRHHIGIPVLPDDYSVVGDQRFPYPVIVDKIGQRVSTPVWLHWRPPITALSACTIQFINYAKKAIEASDDREVVQPS